VRANDDGDGDDGDDGGAGEGDAVEVGVEVGARVGVVVGVAVGVAVGVSVGIVRLTELKVSEQSAVIGPVVYSMPWRRPFGQVRRQLPKRHNHSLDVR